MKNALSLRSYTRHMRDHVHDYYQIVLPLNGHINIEVADHAGAVSVGEGILIKPKQRHHFSAPEAARFIVADLQHVPDNMSVIKHSKFAIDPPLLAFIQFVDKQLKSALHAELESQLLGVFFQLLKQQPLIGKIDKRIAKVIAAIHQNPAEKHSLSALAAIACLGQTQFKKCFQSSMGRSLRDYLTQVRMEKARSLLSYTDLPVSLVAAEVGYDDLSAFSRRFSQYFGQPPRYFSNKI